MKTRTFKIVIAAMLVFSMLMTAVGAATITRTKFNSGTGLVTVEYYVSGDEAVLSAFDAEDETNVIYFNQQTGSGTGKFEFTLPEDFTGETIGVKVGGTNEASATAYVSVTPTPAPTPDPESAEMGGIYNYIAKESFEEGDVTVEKDKQVIYTNSDFDIKINKIVWDSLKTTEDGFNFSSGYMYVNPHNNYGTEELTIKFAPISEGTTKITFDAQLTNGKTWDRASYFGAVINSEAFLETDIYENNVLTEIDVDGMAVGMARVWPFNSRSILDNTTTSGLVRYDATQNSSAKYTSYDLIMNDNATHTYEYIIDMDNKEYTISFDGNTVGTYDFYDDSVETIDALYFRGLTYSDKAHNNTVYSVDNISVKTTQEIQVNNLKFYSETGDRLVREMNVRNGKQILTPDAPQKRGSTFIGWYTEANSEGELADFSNISTDMTVYAAYATKPTIIYMDGETEYKTEIVDYNETITPPVLEDRDGLAFVGWFTEDGKEASFLNIKADMTVYANFMPVIFEYNENFDEGTAIDYTNKAVTGSDFTWTINDVTYGTRGDGSYILTPTSMAGYDGTTSNALNINPKQVVVENIYIKFPAVTSGITKVGIDFKLTSGYSSSPTNNFAELTDSTTSKRVNALTPYQPTYNRPLGSTYGLIRYDSATETVTDTEEYKNTTWRYSTYDHLLETSDQNWHHIDYTVDMDNKTYTMSLDGVVLGTYDLFNSDITSFDSIRFKGNGAGVPHNRGNYWIDNISVVNYGEETVKHSVIFYDEDGTTELYRAEVEDGETAVYGGTTPTKAATTQYTFAFKGWDKALTNITADTTFKAVYSSTVNQYTVTFVDYDGDVLGTSTVDYGTAATAPTAPTREADDEYTYEFSGWDKTFTNVTGAMTVTAQYTATPIEVEEQFITLIWGDMNGDGKIDSLDTSPIQLTIKGRTTVSGGYTVGALIPNTSVIWGDMNGDGKIDSLDTSPIQLTIKGRTTVSGGYTVGAEAKIPVSK